MKVCFTLLTVSAAMIAFEPAWATADHQRSPGRTSNGFYGPQRSAYGGSPSFVDQAPFGYQGVAYPPQHVEEAISQMYIEYLGRAPEPSGLHQWADYVYYQGGTLEEVRAGVLSSQELFARFGYNPTAYVRFLYTEITGSAPTNNELNYWTRQFHSYPVRDYFVRDMFHNLGRFSSY